MFLGPATASRPGRALPRRPRLPGRATTYVVRAAPLYALLFPSNATGSSTSSPYGVIEYANPHSSGFPTRGPSEAGWTVIRRIKPIATTGYVAQFWYSRADGSFAPSDFYMGFHPYPQSGSGGTDDTDHYWEIATTGGSDYIDWEGDSSGGRVVTVGEWRTQALAVEWITDHWRVTMWTDLPTTTQASKIRRTLSSGQSAYSTPTTPKITLGNSPWMGENQEERAACHHGPIKIIMGAMSESDIVSEAANMNALVTSAAQSGIWWGKRGFASVDDLTCDFGTARAFTRNDSSNILTLGEAL